MGFLTRGAAAPEPDRRAVLARALGVATAGLVGAAVATGAAAAPAAAAVRANQTNWRFCTKCYGMFFRGYPTDGACPAGAGHDAQGYDFNLPYNVPETPTAQHNWRFCTKCYGMFF
ncbi:hypothetical protein ACFV1H_20730 [Streptomyces virginiae]|uniref:hypothetical protein n=2 Tax=Streptomyces TaxID=1883 RepID=UPI00368B18E7